MVAFAKGEPADFHLCTASMVLLGSGFSAAATNGALPTMRGFFSRIDADRYPLLHRFVLDVEGDIDEANVERVLVALDQICASPDSMLCDELSVEWRCRRIDIRRSLEDYVLERLGPSAKIDPSNWAIQLLASCSLNTTVISMNYDNIAERVLSNRRGIRHGKRSPTCPHCKMCLMMEKACNCDGGQPLTRVDWEGSIAKPHGSIAWRRCRNNDCCQFDCLVADQHCKPFRPCKCPSCSNDCGPVIVLPSMTKNLDEIPTISTMWEICQRATEEANSLVIFGFSFPASDQLLHYTFKKGFAKHTRPISCAIIDLDPHAVATRIASVFPSTDEVSIHEFPVEIGKVPSWIQSVPA